MSTEIECVRVRETDNAVLIEVDGDNHWIPLSQVKSMHFNMHEKGTIVISDWIAEQKGLA
mgnify:CR=1 FL=1